MSAFIAQGGGCRATYFNHAALLSPMSKPPQITLTESEPPADDAGESDDAMTYDDVDSPSGLSLIHA